MTTHNGWSNKATWLIYCLLKDEPVVKQIVLNSNGSIEEIATELKDFIDTEVFDYIAYDSIFTEDSEIIKQLVYCVFNQINWLELAKYYNTVLY